MEEKRNQFESKKGCIAIPRKVVEESIVHNEKLLVYIYMSLHKSYFDSVTFSINTILKFYHLTQMHIDTKNVCSEIENVVNKFKLDNHPISSAVNSKMKKSKVYTIYFDENYFKIDSSFALIDTEELFDIINLKSITPIKQLLLFLSYYRVNMNRRDKKMHDTIGFKPEIWFFYQSSLCRKLNTSEATCKKTIDKLEEMNIIRTKRLPNHKSEDPNLNEWRSGYLLVADFRQLSNNNHTWQEELEHGTAYVRKRMKEFNKSITGEKP